MRIFLYFLPYFWHIWRLFKCRKWRKPLLTCRKLILFGGFWVIPENLISVTRSVTKFNPYATKKRVNFSPIRLGTYLKQKFLIFYRNWNPTFWSYCQLPSRFCQKPRVTRWNFAFGFHIFISVWTTRLSKGQFSQMD